jgi:hypothetical protein
MSIELNSRNSKERLNTTFPTFDNTIGDTERDRVAMSPDQSDHGEDTL